MKELKDTSNQNISDGPKMVKRLCVNEWCQVIWEGPNNNDVYICKGCSEQLTTCCGARYAPISLHGSHYHRPSCKKYYKSGTEKDKHITECSGC